VQDCSLATNLDQKRAHSAHQHSENHPMVNCVLPHRSIGHCVKIVAAALSIITICFCCTWDKRGYT